jgi:hypothetical protein
MARDPAGTYSYPPGIEGVPDQTIDSNDYNAFLHDVQSDLNFPRPITSGGTGATSATAAMTNLNGEIAKQLVDNYDMFPFAPGSFYSIGGATAERHHQARPALRPRAQDHVTVADIGLAAVAPGRAGDRRQRWRRYQRRYLRQRRRHGVWAARHGADVVLRRQYQG